MSGVPLVGLAVCGTRSNWPSKSRPRFEKCLASPSWSTVSNDRHQYSALVIAAWKRLDLLTQTRTKGGSRETEQTAVAVIACLTPWCSAVATATPEAKWPMTWRNASAEPGTPYVRSDDVSAVGNTPGQLALVTNSARRTGRQPNHLPREGERRSQDGNTRVPNARHPAPRRPRRMDRPG
jgi:hypothetical protein